MFYMTDIGIAIKNENPNPLIISMDVLLSSKKILGYMLKKINHCTKTKITCSFWFIRNKSF